MILLTMVNQTLEKRFLPCYTKRKNEERRKIMVDVKELLAVVILMAFFAFGIMYSAQKEEELVRIHCAGLSGYEYGQCQASIY